MIALNLSNARLVYELHQRSSKKVHDRTISRWRNEDPKVSGRNIQLIAEILRCEPSTLLQFEEASLIPEPLLNSSSAAVQKFSDISSGMRLLAHGDLSMSLSMLDMLLDLPCSLESGDKMGLHSVAAFLNLMNGDFNKAEQYGLQVYSTSLCDEFSESKHFALRTLGWKAIFSGQFVNAIHFFEEATSADFLIKQHSFLNSNYCFNAASASFGLGAAYMYEGQLEKAKSVLTNLMQFIGRPASRNESFVLAAASFNLAFTLIELEEFEQAQQRVLDGNNILGIFSYRRAKNMLDLEALLLSQEPLSTEQIERQCESILMRFSESEPAFLQYELAAKIYRKSNNEKALNRLINLANDRLGERPCMGGIYKECALYYQQQQNTSKASEHFLNASQQYLKAGALSRYKLLQALKK
jgi:tetratricopeptide (TPR) repeat protein